MNFENSCKSLNWSLLRSSNSHIQNFKNENFLESTLFSIEAYHPSLKLYDPTGRETLVRVLKCHQFFRWERSHVRWNETSVLVENGIVELPQYECYATRWNCTRHRSECHIIENFGSGVNGSQCSSTCVCGMMLVLTRLPLIFDKIYMWQ